MPKPTLKIRWLEIKTRLFTQYGGRIWSLASLLFALTIASYIFSRFIGLSEFPIYFFSDEAIQTTLAIDFIKDGFVNYDQEFFPTYFPNASYYNLGLSVYLQVIPYLLFGKSVLVTRGTSVLISLLAVYMVALIMKDIFDSPYWWSAAGLLSVFPTWFLHSRTAFETVTMVAFYAAFLYFYLRYRKGAHRHLYSALIMGALAFYAYNPGRVIVLLTGLLLLISDRRYIWENRKATPYSPVLLLLLALPYIRFYLGHPTETYDHLRLLASYWVQPIPFGEKLALFLSKYLYGLSPGYWFIPHNFDFQRHSMLGYGHIHISVLPLLLVGLIVSIRNLSNAKFRSLLLTLLIAPSAAALVEISIARILVLIIPAALLSAIGLTAILNWIEEKITRRHLIASAVFLLLTVINLGMLRDSLLNGPTWFSDYGLLGMQYGAQQVFVEIRQTQLEDTSTEILLSPNWANGIDVLIRFFLDDPSSIKIINMPELLHNKQTLAANMLFVLTPDDYADVQDSGKFTNTQIHNIIDYPNGEPGFYFVRLQYVENIDEILAEELTRMRQLVEGVIQIDGDPVEYRASRTDIGDIQSVFDQDMATLARTREANPFVIELTFEEPREIKAFSIVTGSAQVAIVMQFYTSTIDDVPFSFDQTFRGTFDHPEFTHDFDRTIEVKIVRIEVQDLSQGEPGNVHVWEVAFK